MRRLLCSVLVSAMAACGGVKAQPDAAVDAPVDAPADAPIDAPIDAPMPQPQNLDLSSAGGRMVGSTFTLDVQLGTPMSQQPIQGPTLRLEGNPPIKP